MNDDTSDRVNVTRRDITLFGISLIAGALACSPARAQSWPAKPVRLVVPFGAGSILDSMMRAMVNELGEALGQSFVIEARPGAGGSVGTASVARSPADGYTILVTGANHTISGAMYSNLPYHPITDFAPVASIASSGYALMVNSALPVNTVEEFIAYTREKKGLAYPSAGIGSNTHLAMALLVDMADLDMIHVPFKSTGDAITEVLSGRGHAMIGANVAIMPFLNDKRVRVLGVTTAERSRFMPEVPTIAESGLPGYEYDTWLALLAPAGTPRPIIDRINDAVGPILRNADVLERFTALGIDPKPMTPEALGDVLKESSENMAKLVAMVGAKAN